MMLRYCANLNAIRYESTSLNRIVADKSHRVIVALTFCIVLAVGSESTNIENLAKCLYHCPDMRHFMMITKNSCFQT